MIRIRLSSYYSRIAEWVGWLAMAYLCMVMFLVLIQGRIMYFPDPVPFDPAKWALPEIKTLEVVTRDNLKLRSWYTVPRSKDGVTVVFFQGAGGHLGIRNYKIRSWIDAGYGVLLVGYRGYGNPGEPSEVGLYQDARASIETLSQQGVLIEKMVLYGESLGTGVAVQMAVEFPEVGGIILESPFTAMSAVGAYHYPLLPIKWMLREKYDSLSKIAAVRAPLLLVHGEADTLVPVKMGRKLFDAANEPKEGVFVPKAGHMDLYTPDVRKAVLAFLSKK